MTTNNRLSELRKAASALNRKRKALQRLIPVRAAMPLFRHRAKKPAEIRHVLFVHTSGGTGDALYLLGLVRRLAANGIFSSIGTLRKHVPLFLRSGLFREVFALEDDCPIVSDFDAAVDLEYVNHNHWELRIPVLKRLQGWRITTGPEMKNMPLYDEYVDYSVCPHVSERFALVCARLINAPTVPPITPYVPIDREAESEVEPFLRSLSGFGRIVYLNTQAGDEDRWFSKEQTIAMLKLLVHLPDTVVVVLPPTAEEITDYLVDTRVVALPKLCFPAFGAFVRSCAWTITPDTSVTHIAACFDKPCLTFFPPNDRDYFIEYGAWEAWGARSSICETVHPDAEDLAVDRYGIPNHPTLCASDIPINVLTGEIRRFARRLDLDIDFDSTRP